MGARAAQARGRRRPLAVVVEFGDGTARTHRRQAAQFAGAARAAASEEAVAPGRRRRRGPHGAARCVRDEVAGAEKATYFVEAAFVSTPVSVVGDFRAPPPDSGAIGILRARDRVVGGLAQFWGKTFCAHAPLLPRWWGS